MRYTAGRGTSRSVISSAIAEQAFGADEQAGEIGSGLLEAVAAERAPRVPSASTASQAEHVIGRHAVAEAVRAAGVERDVAADRADRLARGIGRVVQAVRCGQRGDGEVDDAGLDDGDARDRDRTAGCGSGG